MLGPSHPDTKALIYLILSGGGGGAKDDEITEESHFSKREKCGFPNAVRPAQQNRWTPVRRGRHLEK